MERKVTSIDAMGKIRELVESFRPIHRLDYSVKILKQAREVQRQSGLIEPKHLMLQTMPSLVEEARRLQRKRRELFTLKKEKDRSMTRNKVVSALGTEISGFKTATGFVVGLLQEVKACAVETERDLKKTQEIISVSGFREKTLTEKVLSLTEELSSVRVECANLCSNLYEMTALVQWMKANVGKQPSTVSTKVQKTDEDMVYAV